ncbi:HEAT repeat domain-containing protein [Limnoglobus roseus]|uniref:HEAT repeat domain-containing protein n=1 Tax=Limnoglobus roseus TaxID=2598579 RepID=A0A5C1AGY8_9BACT|nr:HEAT repeat domain-containing protein [Limnoglobus roseus]QEL18080.1 HEAT repeat domain-containing protein [Limnoglobus roseus]
MRKTSALLFLALSVGAGRGQPVPAPAAPAAVKPHEWPKEVGGKDLKGWLAELKDSPDGAMRETAIKAIPLFGPPARKESLLPLMTAVRKETDPGVKVSLLVVLSSIGAETSDEGKKLVDLLKVILNTSPQGSPYKLQTARGLANYAIYANDALSELSNAMEDPSWETRRAVAQTMGLIGRPNEKKTSPSRQALDAISKRIRHEKSVPVRLELVQALVVMGPPVVENPTEYPTVIGPYFRAVNDQLKDEKDKAIQVWLNVLLMLYDGSQLNDATIKKIADFIPAADVGGRIAALRALALLNERSKPFVPIMVDALKSDDTGTVAEAMNALAALEMLARPALPELEKIKATSKDEGLKDLAGQAIDIISGKKAAAPAPVAPPPVKKP